MGDILLCFRFEEAPVPRRGATPGWESRYRDEQSALLSCLPRDQWTGYPLQEFAGHGYRAWLVGEHYPTAARDSAARTVEDIVLRGRAQLINGHCLLLAWMTNTREWHVWTSRFGTVHGYLGQGTQTALGTCFSDVAQAVSKRRLDLAAVRSFVGYGFFLDTATHFHDIEILRPARHYVFDATGGLISDTRYWRWDSIERSDRRFDDSVELFAERLAIVTGDLTRDTEIAIPLSGGLDSRTVLAPLSLKNRPHDSGSFKLYSYGYETDSIETRIARELAEAAGVPIKAFAIGQYLPADLPVVQACLEGFQDVTQARQASIMRQLSSTHVLAAHWGDVWLNASNTPREDVTWRTVEGAFRKRGAQRLLDAMIPLGPEEPQPSDLLRAAWLEYEEIPDPELRLKAFKTDQWSFRWTLASLRMYQAWSYPRLPFYDTRLTDCLQAMLPEHLIGRRLQIEYLKRFAPHLARVRWQARGTDLFSLRRSATLSAPGRAARKLRRLVRGERPLERNWEVQLAGVEGRQWLEDLLLGPASSIGYLFQPSRVKRLLGDFYDRWPDPETGYAVSMLLTLESWYRSHA